MYKIGDHVFVTIDGICVRNPGIIESPYFGNRGTPIRYIVKFTDGTIATANRRYPTLLSKEEIQLDENYVVLNQQKLF
jgi:hypothetical protein